MIATPRSSDDGSGADDAVRKCGNWGWWPMYLSQSASIACIVTWGIWFYHATHENLALPRLPAQPRDWAYR